MRYVWMIYVAKGSYLGSQVNDSVTSMDKIFETALVFIWILHYG